MPFPMPLLVNITVKILFQSKCLENCYNWGVSIWSVKFVSPLTTRISVISLFPARRPWCNNSPKLLCPQYGKRTPKSVRRRSSRVDFRLRNPSSPNVAFLMKALFSILDPHNRVETNTYFVFAHDFVLAVRYLLFFFVSFLYITDSTKFLQCLLFTDSRSQLQHSDTSTKSVKKRKHRKWRGKIKPSMGVGIYCRMLHSFGSLSVRQPVFGKNCSPRAETDCINYIRGRNQF